MGLLKILMIDRRANREKKQEKLDIEMIGLVKKKKKKIKPGYKKKSNGQLMKSGEKLSDAEIVRVNNGGTRCQNDKLSNPFFQIFEKTADFLYELHKEKTIGNLFKIMID